MTRGLETPEDGTASRARANPGMTLNRSLPGKLVLKLSLYDSRSHHGAHLTGVFYGSARHVAA